MSTHYRGALKNTATFIHSLELVFPPLLRAFNLKTSPFPYPSLTKKKAPSEQLLGIPFKNKHLLMFL